MNPYLRSIAAVLFTFHLWLAWVAKPGFFIPAMTLGSIGIGALCLSAWFPGPGLGWRWLNSLPLTTAVLCLAYLTGYFMQLWTL